VIKKHKEGYFKGYEGETIVCTLTGHGLKDPQLAIDVSPSSFITTPPILEEVVKQIFGDISF
jgi:threonine synthase